MRPESGPPATTNHADLRTRQSEILTAMQARAVRRRRARRLAGGSAAVACLGVLAATAWVSLRPPSPVPTDRLTPSLLAHAERPAPEAVTDEPSAAGGRVVTRAISDDELIDLLAEANEEAGLAIVGGRAMLVRWHAEPESPPVDEEEAPGSSARPDRAPTRAHAAAAS